MAKETIYLCNFRVSVEGDWLCLEELDDVQLDASFQASFQCPNDEARDPMAVERANLLDVFNLVVKEVLDASLSHGRMLDDTYAPIHQFFLILEHIFRHGIKPKKGILRDKREFWVVLEQVEKYTPDAVDITTSVRELPNVKSPIGRARAWLRLALMQKRLPDYFRLLVDHRDDILHDFYEPGAIMLEEESQVISGLLVGLNVIDFNMGIKDVDLDKPMGVIDFSLYLNEAPKFQAKVPMELSRGSKQMAAILDQKNYLEELNRHLSATVTNLQQKLEGLQTANTLMTEDITIAKANILQLQEENLSLRREKEVILDEHLRQIQTAQEDIDTERAAYHMSRQGLDTMYQDIQQRLQMESNSKLDLEKQVEAEASRRRDVEMTLKLLEKDARAKQATVGALRKQLEDIKTINEDMAFKYKVNIDNPTEAAFCDMKEFAKQTEQMAQVIQQMEARLAVVDKSNKQGRTPSTTSQ